MFTAKSAQRKQHLRKIILKFGFYIKSTCFIFRLIKQEIKRCSGYAVVELRWLKPGELAYIKRIARMLRALGYQVSLRQTIYYADRYKLNIRWDKAPISWADYEYDVEAEDISIDEEVI